MSKISELSDGGSLQSTDYLIAVRSGGNVKVQANGAASFTTLTASGDVNFDSGTLFVDVSTDRVGVGTTSPDASLHINSSTTDQAVLVESTDTRALIGFKDDTTTVNPSIGGLGNDLVVRTNNAEVIRIDSSGRLYVGTTNTAPAVNNVAGFVSINGTVQSSVSQNICGYFNRITSDGDILQFRKDGAAIGTIGIKTSRLYFATTGDSGIAMSGINLLPTDGTGAPIDDTNDIGFSSFRFQDVYATNGTIQTSDRNEKQDIEELSEAERRVAVTAKGLLRKFRWISSVEEKGDDARIHFGIIAQDLQAAFESEGLDAGRYGMFIHSTWTDEETGEERSRMGVRYSELLAFIIAAL